MIILHYGTNDGVEGLMLVLEPGNIEKLRIGQPIVKRMKQLAPDSEIDFEISLVFTPDSQWVTDQLRAGKSIGKALEDSLGRPEIFLRPFHAEQVERFTGPLKP